MEERLAHRGRGRSGGAAPGPGTDGGAFDESFDDSSGAVIEAEVFLVAALLNAPQAVWPKIAGQLEPEDFHEPTNGLIFAAVTARLTRNQPTDRAIVTAELAKATGQDWQPLIGHLVDGYLGHANAPHWADLIAQAAWQRRVRAAAEDAARDPDKARGTLAALAVGPARPANGTPLGIRPWTWRDPATIPPRPWLYGTMLVRGEITAIGASGGRGKTATLIGTTIAGASGRDLLGVQPRRPCRWLYLHLEESDDEIDRRIAGALLHHRVDADALGGRLYHSRSDGFTIAREMPDGVVVAPAYAAVRDCCLANGIDVIVADPFIATYSGTENSNDVINAVARIWKELGRETNAAVLLSHHFRKGSAVPGDADSFRGGSALIDVARAAYTLSPMSEDDIRSFGVPKTDSRDYLRMDDAKMNMARKEPERWFHMQSERLHNATEDYPLGDTVQVIEPWTPPDAFDGISTHLAREILLAIEVGCEDGDRFTDLRRGAAAKWAGNLIMDMAHKGEAEAAKVLATWRRNGVLEVRDYHSTVQRKRRRGLWLVPSKLPGERGD